MYRKLQKKFLANDSFCRRSANDSKSKSLAIILFGISIFIILIVSYKFFSKKQIEKNLTEISVIKNAEENIDGITGLDITLKTIGDNVVEAKDEIVSEVRHKENLFLTLKRLNLCDQCIVNIVNTFKPHIDLNKLSINTPLRVVFEECDQMLANIFSENIGKKNIAIEVEIILAGNSYKFDKIAAKLTSKEELSYEISKETILPVIKNELITGALTSTLSEAIINSGGDFSLVNKFSDIFGWQIDFFRQARVGDTFQLITEKIEKDGINIGFGEIIAASYTNNGAEYQAFLFSSKDRKIRGYFDNQGKSLKNAFLKAPVKLASINSKFGMRFHPVQRMYKPHNGVDYGAPLGTPILAVANGTVINAGFSRFNGNWVRIRHANGYETEYLHASKISKGIRVGAKVKQGQVIAHVGKTGMATGYHLHFGMKKNGVYVDPTKQIFAREASIPKSYALEFNTYMQPYMLALKAKNLQKKESLALTDS